MLKLPVYLDHNSTTPVDPEVLESMLPYFTEKFGNASSTTHKFGWIAAEAVNQAREKAAEIINATPHEIIFTSGATESVNIGIKGVFEAYRSKGNHFITWETEHKVVLDSFKALEKKGAQVTYLPVTRDGIAELENLESAITDQTVMVCLMYANNETGVIQPVKLAAAIAHKKGCLMMSDASQAIGKIPVDVQEEGIDVLCYTAHKMYGPKGTGALFLRRKQPRVSIVPLFDGGGHERGFRPGTLNVPGIVGFGKACEIAQGQILESGGKLSKLRTRLEQTLMDLGNVYINGSTKFRLPHVSNLSFGGIRPGMLIKSLKEIAVSSGSACTSAIMEPSHVLKAMGLSDGLSYSSIRFSVGKNNTMEEVDFAIKTVSQAVEALRKEV